VIRGLQGIRNKNKKRLTPGCEIKGMHALVCFGGFSFLSLTH
jgi:hypothetical protein